MLAYRPSAFLIDLDDTLYDEKQFVLSGYRAIAMHVAKTSKCSANRVFEHLQYVFLKFGRSGAFDRLISKFDLDPNCLPDLVNIYRNHNPQIDFYSGVVRTLRILRQIGPVAIVTDGAASVQSSKVAALGLVDLVDAVVLCDELGAAKPDVKGFVHGAQDLGLPINKCIIIGDDPVHDLAAAKTLGLQAVRVKTGRFIDLPVPIMAPAIIEIDNFSELPDLLNT